MDDSTLIILNSKDIDMLSYTGPFCQGTAYLIKLSAKCHLILTKPHIHPWCHNPKIKCQFEGEMVKGKVTFIDTMLLDFVSLNVYWGVKWKCIHVIYSDHFRFVLSIQVTAFLLSSRNMTCLNPQSLFQTTLSFLIYTDIHFIVTGNIIWK